MRKQIWLTNEEINRIEEWTKLKIQNVIFDSKIDYWKLTHFGYCNNYSKEKEFYERISNKENLLFLIKSNLNVVFGGFVSKQIKEYDEYFLDPSEFLFSFKNNEPIKIDLEEENKNDCLYGHRIAKKLIGESSFYKPNIIMVIQMKNTIKTDYEKIQMTTKIEKE